MQTFEPGRDLDKLIADKVMGLKCSRIWSVDESGQSYFMVVWGNGVLLQAYSTDIAAAWEVVEKLCKDSFAFDMEYSEFFDKDAGGCDARFRCKAGIRGKFSAEAETAPHAVCLAALKAVGYEGS